MGIWFTSDEHWDHRNIIEYCCRPFSDVESMVEGMIERHNERVSPGDEVWHLGDFSLDPRTALKVLPRLNGKHHLISGNHDWSHPSHSQSRRRNSEILYVKAGFSTVRHDVFLPIAGVGTVRLCHLPYAGDSRDGHDRHEEWRPIRGSEEFLIHGHVHGKWRTADRMVNVGVDVWDWRPVSLEEVLDEHRRAS